MQKAARRRYLRGRRRSLDESQDLADIARRFGRRKKRKRKMKKTASQANRYRQLLGELKRFLKMVGVSEDAVIIASSGLLGAMNLRDVGDLDVQVPERADFDKLRRLPGAIPGRSKLGSPLLTIKTAYGEMEIFTGRWSLGGRDFTNPSTVKYNGMKHWDLPTTLDFKRRMDRKKDRKDIGLLGKKASFMAGFLDELQKLADEKGLPLLTSGKMLQSKLKTPPEAKLKEKPWNLMRSAKSSAKKVSGERPKGFQRGFTHEPPKTVI